MQTVQWIQLYYRLIVAASKLLLHYQLAPLVKVILPIANFASLKA